MEKKQTLKPCSKKPHGEEPMLGKRHPVSNAGNTSFLSLAISLGFTNEEIKQLSKIYDGPAKPDTREENQTTS